MSTVCKILFCSSKKLEEDGFLDVKSALDRWCNRLSEHTEYVLVFGELSDILEVLLAQLWPLLVSEETLDPCGYENASEIARLSSVVDSEYSRHLNSVSWFE